MTQPYTQLLLGGLIAAAQFAVAAGSTASPSVTGRTATSQPAAAATASPDFDVLRVRDHIYMLVGPAANTTVAFGQDGVMIVNAQSEAMAPKLLAAVAKLTDQPIRYIVNTDSDSANTGGNVIVTQAGRFITDRTESNSASIVAHENTLNRLSGVSGTDQALPQIGWPSDVYYKNWMDFHFNGEAIQVIYEPNAHTDGDSVVFFRGSDVISTGDLFNPEAYPVIDLARGGTYQGIIDALNRLIDLAVPDFNEEGGTMIIPGHGRVTDEYELVIYRDMLTIIRDRVRDLIRKGMTLEQVQAARPTRDYDGIYGSTTGPWTTRMFVAAVYQDLHKP
jgi:glyoxylase-like metal-dependent hydrolase (beta-lactamase superfamily II)